LECIIPHTWHQFIHKAACHLALQGSPWTGKVGLAAVTIDTPCQSDLLAIAKNGEAVTNTEAVGKEERDIAHVGVVHAEEEGNEGAWRSKIDPLPAVVDIDDSYLGRQGRRSGREEEEEEWQEKPERRKSRCHQPRMICCSARSFLLFC